MSAEAVRPGVPGSAVKRLIVNADDYGRAPSVSAGIRQAHLSGIVTSTTIMINMRGIAEALRAARAECPGLGLGVHLVLTAGRPVLDARNLPRLAALSKTGAFPPLSVIARHLDAVDAVEVRAEWRAQVERFVRVAGRPPTHLDSHHHISYVSPRLFEVMLDLARELGCAIRWPIPVAADPGPLLDAMPVDLTRALPDVQALLARTSDVPHPDRFEARFFGEGARLTTLRDIIAHLPDGVTELMCHPGLPDEQLHRLTGYHRQRAEELAALTDPDLRAHLSAAGVELATFADLLPT